MAQDKYDRAPDQPMDGLDRRAPVHSLVMRLAEHWDAIAVRAYVGGRWQSITLATLERIDPGAAAVHAALLLVEGRWPLIGPRTSEAGAG
jgi:hypothetical protein